MSLIYSVKAEEKLILVKIAHTVAWAFFAGWIFYLLYSGISGNITELTWWAIGFTIFEGIILLLFKWSCPLTIVARRYSDSTADNFDIYLPNWLARHNKTIFTSLFVIGLILVLMRCFTD